MDQQSVVLDRGDARLQQLSTEGQLPELREAHEGVPAAASVMLEAGGVEAQIGEGGGALDALQAQPTRICNLQACQVGQR